MSNLGAYSFHYAEVKYRKLGIQIFWFLFVISSLKCYDPLGIRETFSIGNVFEQ